MRRAKIIKQVRHVNSGGDLEIRIFEVDGRPKYVTLNGFRMTSLEMLAFAERLSDKSMREAEEFLSLASRVFHPADDWAFNELYGAVRMHIAWKESVGNTEAARESYFKNNVAVIVGEGAKIAPAVASQKHRPDGWVVLNGNLMPVEIKKGNFDAKALRQLTRYMDYYKTSNGIAIGRNLTVELPDNIQFYCCKGWVDEE